MRINTIKLNNIGPYKSLNIFELDSKNSKDHNITLIGGKNGTGKTTLLKSIKIGLFGCFSFGFKNANSTYFKEIRNLLNNKCDKKSRYFIEITLSFTENYKIQKYTLHREWKIEDENIVEILTAKRADSELNDYDTLELENKLKSLTSPALINSFIYDGEKISAIIEQGELESYVREMFNSIFNIDLLEQLSQDLTSYMIRSYKQNNRSVEYELAQVLNMLNFVKSDIKTNENYVANITKEIDNIKIKIASFKKEFTTLGGISKEDIAKITALMLECEKKKEENNAFVRAFCEEDLHLVMLIDGLKKITKKAKAELPLRYAKQLEMIQNYLNVDLSNFINLLKVKTKCSIFNLDENEIEELDNTIEDLEKIREKAVNILLAKNSIVDNINELKYKLEKNATMNKLIELSQKIEEQQNALLSKTEELYKIQLILKDRIKERDNLIKKYDSIAENVKKDKLVNSSYIQCTNSLRLCEMFKEKMIEKKLMQVSQKACEIFNKTIRKNNYINKMQFDKNFSFKLYDGHNAQISPELLSAGEMQILVSSLIWAMFKVSERKEVFVFDTPLARLDTENRIQFIKNIVSTISEQVIILSTDSEFIGENLKSIEENLFSKYLLEYDDVTKATRITGEYFGG